MMVHHKCLTRKEELLAGILLLFLASSKCYAQSFEVMPGTQRIFIDAQYLALFNNSPGFSLFSRARATTEYDEQTTDLFIGAYLNYTTKSGFGGTVLGRISSFNSGVDVGGHYFKANDRFMIYALPSINLGSELLYSWFSILRFTPKLKGDWKLYTSLELFSAFVQTGHTSSVQRIRVGVDKRGYQFGLAVNFASRGKQFELTDTNSGVFLRKQF